MSELLMENGSNDGRTGYITGHLNRVHSRFADERLEVAGNLKGKGLDYQDGFGWTRSEICPVFGQWSYIVEGLRSMSTNDIVQKVKAP